MSYPSADLAQGVPSDIFFTPAVKSEQSRRGSRAAYARKEQSGEFHTTITPELAAWLTARDSFYLATASAAGQPYIQHRGGAAGFLRVLDGQTLAFADYRGNRQFITLGNLAENDRAMLFFTDYETRSRIKVWGRARVVENDPELTARLMLAGDNATAEQVIIFRVEVWDANCSKHIPAMVRASEVAPMIAGLRQRVAELEALLVDRAGSQIADQTHPQ